MKDEGSRPTLRSYLADSGVPPEKFLEALALLNEEIRALLDDVRPAPAAPPPPADATENDNIRRILEEIKARWVQQDRAKARAEAQAPPPVTPRAEAPPPPATPPAQERPPAAQQDAKRITVETVILKGPAGPRSQPRPPGPPAEAQPLPPAAENEKPAAAAPPAPPPPADDQPTTFIRVGSPAPSAPPPTAPPAQESGEMLLETVIRTSPGKAPGARGPQEKEPPAPAAEPPEDDDMAKTVIIRPDQLKDKGKGGHK